MKIKEPNMEQEEQTVDNKLELLKYTSTIQGALKDDLTSDYTLARFTQQEKEFIIEQPITAYYAKRLIQKLKRSSNWTWDKKKGWIKQNHENNKQLIKLEKKIFKLCMYRPDLISIANRNVDKNTLLRYLAGLDDTGTKVEEEEEKKLSTKLKKLISPKEEKEDV